METALVLWEACAVPSLLHGSGTWVEMSFTTENPAEVCQGGPAAGTRGPSCQPHVGQQHSGHGAQGLETEAHDGDAPEEAEGPVPGQEGV